jgi:hypothetical protein
MSKPMLFLAAALSLQACTAETPVTLTAEEAKLAGDLHFDTELMKRAKPFGTGFTRMMAMTEDGAEIPAAGIVLLTAPDHGEAALKAVRGQLANSPYGAWLNDNAHGTGPDKIAILKTRDQFEYLALARTDGINYDLTHEKVIERYREWAAKYGLELDGAGLDWISAHITKPPADWQAFAAEVYEFCPDVVLQGTGDVGALARAMQERRELFLWWD